MSGIAGRLTRCLLARDMLGHSLSINYKGEGSFNTKLGGFLSLVIQTLVLTYLFMRTTELITMSDPTVQSYSRPLYREEVEEFGAINMHDFRFNFGVVAEINGTFEPLPKEFGRFML